MMALPVIITISIHPPLAGRDIQLASLLPSEDEFQSTRPLRDGTLPCVRLWVDNSISIHPPLAGRDEKAERLEREKRISIHPPLAGRDGVATGPSRTA